MAIEIHVTTNGKLELRASRSYVKGEAGGDFTSFERLVRTEADGTKVIKDADFRTYQEVATSEIPAIVRSMIKNGEENRVKDETPAAAAEEFDGGDDLDEGAE